jgi:hypothetical protein
MRQLLIPLAGVLFLLTFPLVAQQSDDPLPALLNEVRLLRLAMERSATVSPRIQLLTSRMALQDERVYRFARQAESVRDELDRVTFQNREFATRAKQMEELLALEADPAKRREIEEAQRFMKSEAELQNSREQLLRARESEAATLLATEQTRWMELSQALDELERMLAR